MFILQINYLFKVLKNNDRIKNAWAKNNKYILIRLDYLMSNAEKLEILETIKSYNSLRKG